MSTRNTYLNSLRNKKNIYFLVETKHHLMQRSYFCRRKYNSIYNSKYRIYPKYSVTSTPYHICSKIWTSTIHYPMLCLKNAGWVANSVDPDEMPRSAASHLGLYCLLRPVCRNIYGKYGMERSRTFYIGTKHILRVLLGLFSVGQFKLSTYTDKICFAAKKIIFVGLPLTESLVESWM